MKKSLPKGLGQLLGGLPRAATVSNGKIAAAFAKCSRVGHAFQVLSDAAREPRK
jgi:hypothetical protein